MSDYRFKLGMFLPELGLPFDEGLARAKEIGADSVWFTSIADEPPIAEMSDAEAGRMAARVAKHGLELHVIAAGAPFKQLHLADLDLDTMQDDPAFRKEFDDLVRSMQIAVHLGIKTVNTFTFAWPGEYGPASPPGRCAGSRAAESSPTWTWRSCSRRFPWSRRRPSTTT